MRFATNNTERLRIASNGTVSVKTGGLNLENATATSSRGYAITNAAGFLRYASLSTTNYDSTLRGWSSQSVQNGVSADFGNSQYSTATGLAYRNALVASGWTITDGGAA